MSYLNGGFGRLDEGGKVVEGMFVIFLVEWGGMSSFVEILGTMKSRKVTTIEPIGILAVINIVDIEGVVKYNRYAIH